MKVAQDSVEVAGVEERRTRDELNAAEALRRRENESRTLLENLPQKIFFKDRHSVYISCNGNYARDLEIKSDEIEGKTDYDFYPKGLAEKYRADDKRIMESGRTEEIDEEYVEDGQKTFVHTVKTPVKDEKGNVVGILGIFWEITERRKMEEALRESEEKYRTQFEEALDAIFVADAETGIMIDCNHAASELVGREKSELIGEHQRILHPAEENEGEFSRTFKQHLTEKEGQVLETQVVTKRGEIKDVAIKANVIELRGKKLIQGIFRDITERKKAEEEIGNLAKFPSENPNPVLRIAKDGVVLFANTATKSMLNELRIEIGQPAPHHWRQLVADALNSGLRKEVEVENEGRVFLFTITPVTDAYVNMYGLDVTQIKKSEEELRESEEKYRKLIENSKDSIVTIDLKGNVLFANKTTEELTGYTKENGARMNVRQVTPMRYWPQSLAMLMKAREGKPIPYFESMIRKRDGTFIPVESGGQAIFKDGKVVGVQIITRDISERKKTEERIRESEEKYRSIFENARDVILTFDLNGNVTSVNKIAAEYGFKVEEMIGKNMLKFASKKYWPKLLKDLTQLAQGKPVENEIEIVTSKGKRTVEYRSNPIRLGDKVVGFQAILIDVTERKQVAEALRESEERLKQLIEYAPDAIYINDLKGNFIDGNKQAENLTGYKKEELVGKNLMGVGLLSKRFLPKVMKDLAMNLLGQKTGPDEYELIKKDGRHVIAEISTFPVKREGKVEVVGIARDISERKEAEKAIRESQRKFEQLFMSNPEATVFSDVDDHVLDVNPRFSELFGYSHSEAKGRLLDDLIVPDDLKEEAKKLTDIREGYIYHDTVRKKKDGSLVPVSISSASITSENQHLGNVVQYKDITERKKAEEKIRESEEKYRNLFENARDLILTVDLEGNITSANSALLEYGYSKSELLGKSLFNIFPKEYSQRFRDFFQDFAQGRPVEGEFKIQSKAKQGYSIVEYKGNPIIQNNRTVGVQVIVRDITDRKEMEEKLRQYSERLEELVEKRTDELLESENRYSVLVEEASDGVAILQDGKILFANKKGSEITGYSKDELIGLPFEKLVSEEYKHLAKERYERRLRGEKLPPTYEIKLIAKTGDQIPVELSATHIHHQGSPADLIIVRDVRERKRMEEERLRLEKLAAIGELATMVGHDLRNPLQSIGNAAYYLNNELPQLCPSAPNHNTAIEMLQAIDDSIKYADKIIRDLQDFSSIKKPTLRKTEINVTIKEALSQVKIPENVELRTELGCVPEILVDEDQMKRVFLNLATNAIQAMEKGGTMVVSTKRTGDFVEVSFKDTGVGISKENMGNIFKPLFTTKAKGMGMGLPICKKFVESHGGIINVESEVGKGTTLTVKLPVQLEHGGENH